MGVWVILQAQSSASSVSVLQSIGFLIMLTMTGGGIFVVVKWPSQIKGRVVGGVLLTVLPWTGVIVAILAGQLGVELPLEVVFFMPLAWVLWFGLYVFSRIEIRREQKRAESMHVMAPPGRTSQMRPYSAGAAIFSGPAAHASAGSTVAVVARCTACMGRWKTTEGEANALPACPKCGISPLELRLQVVE